MNNNRKQYCCNTNSKTKQNKRNNKQALYCEMTVFWVVAPCSLVEVYQRFRGPCCLHHQGARCYNPEDSHLHTHRRENFRSYLGFKL
jgi:hypothetical protein